MKSEAVFEKYINSSAIATAILDQSGKVCWANPSMLAMLGFSPEGRRIANLIPGIDTPDTAKRVKVKGVTYKKETTPLRFDGREYELLRLVDSERAVKTLYAHRALLPVMCYIEIDNFKALAGGLSPAEASSLSAQIDGLISSFVEEKNGMMLKWEGDKYFLCFEHKFLHSVQQERFSLLDQVRAIATSAGQSPTLSIAVGAGKTPRQSEEFAKKALELAQGRGGDQAVVKDADGYLFYGGIQKAVEVRSRVRTRTVSKALRNLMEQCDDVFIMGHEVPDLDCMGAALGLLACGRVLSKPVHIILDKPNAAIDTLVSEMKRSPDYRDVIITPTKAHLMMGARSMLIVVDTQIGTHTIAPYLIGAAKTLVVIDHHLRGTVSIENAALLYHEPYASSTAEMVTEIVQYFSERLRLRPLEAEALMAGVTIDTKGFSFKTGVRTFEAASYLRRAGANTTAIRQMFQDDLETFLARAEVVRRAEVKEGIAVAVCPEGSKNPELLAAQAADSLLGIRGILASFVLSAVGGHISVSGRSLGNINVQLILERLGGGGHATIAGAQLRQISMDEACRRLKDAIHAYLKENRPSEKAKEK